MTKTQVIIIFVINIFLSTTYPYWAISGDSYENWNRVKKEFGKYLDMHVAVFLKFNREDVSVS